MIDFQRISLHQKEQYTKLLSQLPARGCEYSFANLFLWGRQHMACREGCIALFSHFYGKSVYPFPIGDGDKAGLIRAIIHDAEARGIPCRITGITEADKAFLEEQFPDTFHFRSDRGSFDYVYDIDALADLKGRKYQKKRNHVNRFQSLHPQWRVEPLTKENLLQAQALAERWYADRRMTDPDGDYLLEHRALARAFAHYEALDLEGIALYDGEDMVALTIGSQMQPDTFDIHFEKALEDVDGAYPAVNQAFARYLREKYPSVRYLNREDDMGLEGLRKAKLSYLPCRMVEKYRAYRKEELYAP